MNFAINCSFDQFQNNCESIELTNKMVEFLESNVERHSSEKIDNICAYVEYVDASIYDVQNRVEDEFGVKISDSQAKRIIEAGFERRRRNKK